MRSLLIIISVFVAVIGRAQELFVTLEDIAAGTADSSINIGTISKTNGNAVAFSYLGSEGKVTVQNWGGTFGLHAPVTVAGVRYTNSAPTKILQVVADNTVTTQQQFEWTFAASRKSSVGFMLVVSNFNGLGSYYNPGGFSGGTPFSVLSLINNNPVTLQAETNSNVGASINIANNLPVWCTGLWDSANGKTMWDFYNMTSGVFIGRSSGAVTVNSTVNKFAWGIHDAHTKDPGTVYRMNHVILYTNGTVWPVFPGGGIHFPTNFTPTGVSAALAASAAGEEVLLPATNVTWTSGTTVSQDGRVVRGLGGTNATVILADGVFTAFTLSGSYNTVSNLQIRGDGTTDEADGFLFTGSHNTVSHTLLRELNVGTYFSAPSLFWRNRVEDCWRTGGRVIFSSGFYDANYPLAWNSTNVACMEDNVYAWTSAKNQTGAQAFLSSQVGQAFVFRHNEIQLNASGVTAAPVFDYHGDSSGLSRPGVVAQIYSNRVVIGATDISGNKFVDLRGSRALVYSNLVTGATYDTGKGVVMRKDSISGTTSWLVNNTHVWANKDGTTGTHDMAVAAENSLTLGVEWFDAAPVSYSPLPYPHPTRTGIAVSDSGATQTPAVAPGRVSGFQFRGE